MTHTPGTERTTAMIEDATKNLGFFNNQLFFRTSWAAARREIYQTGTTGPELAAELLSVAAGVLACLRRSQLSLRLKTPETIAWLIAQDVLREGDQRVFGKAAAVAAALSVGKPTYTHVPANVSESDWQRASYAVALAAYARAFAGAGSKRDRT